MECLTYCKNMDTKIIKLGPRGINSACVGYTSNSKAYWLFNLESNVIIKSRDLEFFENVLATRNSQNKTQDIHTLENHM